MRFDTAELKERLVGILRGFQNRRILVVGDAIADRFVHGEISRVSREAPVFIIRHEHTETVPGGAANCATNLASLGARVSLVSVAGQDEAGDSLIARLQAAPVNCDGIVRTQKKQTTTKVRILAGQSHSTRQQVVRIDYEDEPLTDPEVNNQLQARLREEASDVEAIVISDYNYGVADVALAEIVKEIADDRRIPVLVDSRYRLLSFKQFTSATPNESEVEELIGRKTTSADDLSAVGEALRKSLGFSALLITRGSQGMVLLEEGAEPFHLEAIGADQPVDVTGAGDTVMAVYTLATAAGASFRDAASLANHAGGLVVMKRGTASVTISELEHSILHS